MLLSSSLCITRHALQLMNDSIAGAVASATSPEKETTVAVVLTGECVDGREFGSCRENHVVDNN